MKPEAVPSSRPERGPAWPPALRALRSVLALAVLLLPGCSGLPGASRPARLHYVITVDPGSAGATVVVTASGSVPHGFRMLLPPQGRRRELHPLAALEEGEVAVPGTSVRYRVYAPGPPHSGAGFACYRGFELLAQPAGLQPSRLDSITLEFRLPAGQAVVAPLAILARDPDAPGRGPIALRREEFDTLLESYVALGDYRVRVVPGVADRLPPSVWGRRGLGATSEAELLELVERLLAAHVDAFGPDRVEEPLSVVVDYPYAGHGFAGNATGRSIDLRLSRDLGPADSPGLVRLVSHELAHFWLGGAFRFPKPEDHWFVEGAADYYGLRARVATGLTDPAQAGDELADKWYEMSGNRWLHEPMEDLGRHFNDEAEAFTASYARGCVTAWALDWRARTLGRPALAEALKSDARDNDHPPMRQLLATHLRGPDWKPGALGEDPGSIVGELLGPEPERPLADALAAAGLEYRAVPTQGLTFGLERFEPGTTRLLSVPPGSPARTEGIRPGDAIREVDGLPVGDTVDLEIAIERSYARPSYKLEGMEVTYERAGTFDRVRLFAAPEVRPMWVDESGERAGQVLP
jgi:predicted metalloprotease with PDZ domain